MLRDAAVENVKTWRFQNPYAIERKYETTFEYELPLSIGRQKVTFESFHKVEIVTHPPLASDVQYRGEAGLSCPTRSPAPFWPPLGNFFPAPVV
jgi:hypothetical protein